MKGLKECGAKGTKRPVAVVDTNIILDTHAAHDWLATYRSRELVMGGAALDEHHVAYRTKRARESMLLAIYLDKLRAVTCSLHNEGLDIMTKRVPPRNVGGPSEVVFFTEFTVWFVFERVLPNWNRATFNLRGGQRGNQADLVLIEHAKKHRLPLLTNEGNLPGGIVDVGIRKKAKAAGVRPMAPSEFYDTKIDEAAEVDRFFERFRAEAPRYLRERQRRFGDADGGEAQMAFMHRFYLFIFGRLTTLGM